MEGFMADLVRRHVDIIVVTGTRETIAAKRATSSIPIVTFLHPDVIGGGLAQSLARPGGNLTGLTTLDTDLYGKRLEMLKQVVPNLTRAGVLVSGRQPSYGRGSPWEQAFQAAARSLKIELVIADAHESNLESVLDALATGGVHGLVITSDGIYVAEAKALAGYGNQETPTGHVRLPPASSGRRFDGIRRANARSLAPCRVLCGPHH
jgi:putative ABC transport system substrate-binding protein